jgi:hypothetical protein
MSKRTSIFDTKGAPREERIRHFVPCAPGSFVVFYDVRKRELVQHAIMGWGVREREEWRFRDGEPDDYAVCDYVEAMVATKGAAEVVFASDLYEPDERGQEVFRILGIRWPGDGVDWKDEMNRDVRVFETPRSATRRRKKADATNATNATKGSSIRHPATPAR